MHCFFLGSSSVTIFYAPHIISLYSHKVMCKIARQLCEKSIASEKSMAGLQYLKKESAKLSRKSQGVCLCHSRFIIIYYLILNYLLLCFNALYCIAVHCIALLCSALQCSALHCIAVQCIALHCCAVHCSAVHCIALQCSVV
jgi:hypothetical protein